MEENETLDFTVDDLFKDDSTTLPNDTVDTEDTPAVDEDVLMTKAVSERINSVKRKTENETQDKIAKELGYADYTELQRANEKKLLRDAGLDEEEISGVVNKLLEQRLANDPRMKKLEEYEAIEKNHFVNSQIEEINKLTGSKYTSVDQLPKDTLKVWELTGNLKQAYLATQGEALLTKKQAVKENGSLNHLASSANGGSSQKTRALTEDEKAIWRSVIPDITDDELSKKTVNVD